MLFIPCYLSCLICGLAWHYTGIMPYSTVTLDFAMFAVFAIACIITTSALLIASFLGRSQVLSIIASCFIALFLIMIPGIFHTMIFGGKSLFDPSLVPQWVVWLSLALLPPFTILAITDSMTSALSIFVSQ